MAPKPLIIRANGGLKVFEVESLETGKRAVPVRHRVLKPHFPKYVMLRDDATQVVVNRSRLTWLWPRRFALIALALLWLVLGATVMPPEWFGISVLVVPPLIGFLWSWLYAEWWSRCLLISRIGFRLQRKVWSPDNPASIGGESIDEISGKPYAWALWFRLDVGKLTIASSRGSVDFKHVPNYSTVLALLEGVNASGGQAGIKAALELLVMQALFGSITPQDVDHVLGEGTVKDWRGRRREDTLGPLGPPTWPGGPEEPDVPEE